MQLDISTVPSRSRLEIETPVSLPDEALKAPATLDPFLSAFYEGLTGLYHRSKPLTVAAEKFGVAETVCHTMYRRLLLLGYDLESSRQTAPHADVDRSPQTVEPARLIAWALPEVAFRYLQAGADGASINWDYFQSHYSLSKYQCSLIRELLHRRKLLTSQGRTTELGETVSRIEKTEIPLDGIETSSVYRIFQRAHPQHYKIELRGLIRNIYEQSGESFFPTDLLHIYRTEYSKLAGRLRVLAAAGYIEKVSVDNRTSQYSKTENGRALFAFMHDESVDEKIMLRSFPKLSPNAALILNIMGNDTHALIDPQSVPVFNLRQLANRASATLKETPAYENSLFPLILSGQILLSKNLLYLSDIGYLRWLQLQNAK